MWTPHAHWPLSASSCHSHSSPDSFSSETSSWPPAPVAPLPPRTSPNSRRNPYGWTGPGLCGLVPPPPPLLSFCPPSSSLPLCPVNRLQPGLLGSCFCQLERRRGRPFPFSWLSFSSVTGTEGRICSACSHCPPSFFLHTHFKKYLSSLQLSCSHMRTRVTALLCFTVTNTLLCLSLRQSITLTTSPVLTHMTLKLKSQSSRIHLPIPWRSPSVLLSVHIHPFFCFSYSFPVLPSQQHVSPFLLSPFPPAPTPLLGLPHSYIYNYLSVLTPTHLSSSAVSCSQILGVSP